VIVLHNTGSGRACTRTGADALAVLRDQHGSARSPEIRRSSDQLAAHRVPVERRPSGRVRAGVVAGLATAHRLQPRNRSSRSPATCDEHEVVLQPRVAYRRLEPDAWSGPGVRPARAKPSDGGCSCEPPTRRRPRDSTRTSNSRVRRASIMCEQRLRFRLRGAARRSCCDALCVRSLSVSY